MMMKKKYLATATGILILLLLPMALQTNAYVLHILFLISIKGYFSICWNIMSGYSGQMSLGHGTFLGLGAYFSTLLCMRSGVNPWIAMLLSALAVCPISLILGIALFRLREAFFALATMALVSIAKQLMIYFKDFSNGTQGLSLPISNEGIQYIYFTNKMGYVYIGLVMLVMALAVSAWIQRNKLGLYLFSLRDDHDAAASLGINTMNTKLLAMVISAFMISMGGSLYAHYTLYIDPKIIFDPQLSMDMTVMAMLGGIGTLYGPLLGAVLLVPLDTLLRALVGGGSWAGADLIVYGVVLITIIRFCPQGLLPLFRSMLAKRRSKRSSATSNEEKHSQTSWAKEEMAMHDVICVKELGYTGPILKVENLCVFFGGLKAVNNVNFEVKQREIFGIIGPNGAGKTTIFNAVTGFFKPTSGNVHFMGKQLKEGIRPNELAHLGLTRTFQSVKPFYKMTLRQSVMAGALIHDKDTRKASKRADSILSMLGLQYRADQPPTGLTIAEQKRLDMARALAINPRLLMLDEPMAGLTDNEVNDMMVIIRRLRDHGITIVVIEHVMHAVMNLCERVVVLDHGEIIDDGAPADVVKNPHVIEVYLGEKIDG